MLVAYLVLNRWKVITADVGGLWITIVFFFQLICYWNIIRVTELTLRGAILKRNVEILIQKNAHITRYIR